MKLSKFVKRAKSESYCMVIHADDSGIWLGTRSALYNATELPEMEGKEQVGAVLDIDSKAWEKMFFDEKYAETGGAAFGMNLTDADPLEQEARRVPLEMFYKGIQHAAAIDEVDKKYEKHYPLYEWGWDRAECVRVIERAGLPKPGKSSCYFCPSMKKKEIQALWENNPELFQRAVDMEHNAADSLTSIKGLGRKWSWESYHDEFIEAQELEKAQLTFDDLFPEAPGGCLCGAPCGCYDG